MTRIAIAFGLGLAWALAACGGRDDAQEAARKATEVTVESAQTGAPTGQAAGEHTQVTVESAETGKSPSEE